MKFIFKILKNINLLLIKILDQGRMKDRRAAEKVCSARMLGSRLMGVQSSWGGEIMMRLLNPRSLLGRGTRKQAA
jgi:hypothetical protein